GRFNLILRTDADGEVIQQPNTAPDTFVATQSIEVLRGPYSDLVVESITAPATGTNGQVLTLSWTVANRGIALTDTDAWSDSVYFTTDPAGTTGRRLIGVYSRAGRLDVGGTYTRTVETTVPSDATGTGYFVVTTGGPYEAIFTDNNSRRSDPIAITFIPPPQADLELTSVSAPSEAPDGASIDVSWTVRNNGPDVAAGAWTDTVYLAPNGTLAGATVLGSFRVDQALDAGKSYTRTIAFHLPVKIQGVYSIIIRTDTGGAVDPDRAANNQRSSGALIISLRSRPDLQVTSATGPEIVTAGTAIDVSWTVANLGATATPPGGSRWTDAVYLSLNNVRDGGDILLGTLPNGQALAPGQNYTSTASFRLPREVAGNAFILIVPDSTDAVDEVPSPLPDVFVLPIAIDAIPVPPPDLVVTQVTAPIEAFDGTSIVVRFSVENRGPGPTEASSWTDSVWLTLEKDRPNPARGDVAIGYVGHSGILAPGDGYETALTVRLPPQLRGQFYITAWTDSGDRVFETALEINVNPDAPNDLQGSNFKATGPISVLLQPSADLVVTEVVAPPTATGGNQVTLNWTVRNEGPIPTDVDRWVDAVYISDLPDLKQPGSNPIRVFAAPNFGTLLPGQSYTQTATFTLPPSAEGKYFIVSTNESPDILSSPEGTLFSEVEAIIRRAEREFGKPLSDVTLADARQLTPGQLRRILTDPKSTSPRTVFEGPFTDNNQRSAPSAITNHPADLVVVDVRVSPSVFSGESIEVTWTVRNDGAAVFAGTREWEDWILFSSNPVWTPAEVLPLGSLIHVQTTPLLPGETYTATASFKIPEGISGPRYIYVATDPNVSRSRGFSINLNGTGPGSFPGWPSLFAVRVWEGATKANNVRGATTEVVYREADLFLVEASGPAAADSSGIFTIDYTTRNDGTRATRLDRWFDSVYLSRDTTIDTSDKVIGTTEHRGILEPGASYSGTIQAQLPDNIDGPFHLIVITNAGYSKAPGDDPRSFPGFISTTLRPVLNEYAGTASNQRILDLSVRFVPGPDLRVSVVTASERVLVGQSFTTTWTVVNSGAGAVPDRQHRWSDYVYLSRDQFLDVRSDAFLGQFRHEGVLVPDGTYTVTATFTPPRGILGPYYVFVVSDPQTSPGARGDVVESSETNNARATEVPMLIELPPPSDLQVDAVVGPLNASVGAPINVTLTVINRGTEPAKGAWYDTLYLSADGIWDYGDRLLGTADPPQGGRNLAPGASYTTTLQVVIPPALPGTYRLIARTDNFNDIHEGPRDDNNLGVGADPILIQVPLLTVGVPAALDLPALGQALYRVEAEAGETLEISFTAASGLNELYVAYEAVPNSLQYDAAFEGRLDASQTAVIPTTRAGTYYILVRAQGGRSTGTLAARSLPFGITQISPDDVGSGRYVTVTVRGARFDPQATLKLIRPQFGEYVPVTYDVVDATRIVAVFDLRNAPLGLYDIQVANPNGDISIIPYRFLISQPQPLDVTIGLGGPDEILLSKSGFPSAYYGVSFDSLTNVDTPYVFFQYGVPRIENTTFVPGERLVFQTNLQGSPNIPGIPWANLDPVLNLDGVLTASGFAIDFRAHGFDARTFALEIYPGIQELLAENPNFLRELSDDALKELEFEFYIFAAITPLSTEDFLTFQRGRAEELRQKILADVAAPQSLVAAAGDSAAFQDFYLQALVRAGVLRYEDVPPSPRISAEFDSNLAVEVAGLLGTPEGAEFIVNQTDGLAAFFEQIRAWANHDPDAFGGPAIPDGTAYDLGLPLATRFEAFRIRVKVPDDFFSSAPVDGGGGVLPGDPSLGDFLTGAAGTAPGVVMRGPSAQDSPLNIVPGGSTRLPYLIQFANPADGQPIRELRVVQEIDPDLDIRSFQLASLRFGDLTLGLPQGRGAFSAEFDLTATRGFVLQMSAGIDVVTGIASWVFRTIDPVTGLLASGDNVGLLRAGETGEVSYTIRAHPEAPSGASLDARARVFFGDSTPFDTNLASARLDNAAPVSTLTTQTLPGNRYLLEWSAVDDPLGSGVLQYSVYVSLDGRFYSALETQTTSTSLSYAALDERVPQFLVLAADVAGNLEAAPPGLSLTLFPPAVRLGAVPIAVPLDREVLPVLPPASDIPLNPLFVQAALGVPGALPTSRLPGFDRVLSPFAAASFARGIAVSGAGVGAIGVALAPDGSLLVSGGAGRNQLFRIGVGGNPATQPFATLPSPVYAITYDRDGNLWATTGGGALLELDPASGSVLASYSVGVTLGLVADPEASRLFVATGEGVQIFDTTRRAFTPFSRTLVEGLALAPDGSLWGIEWPGEVGASRSILRFDSRGRASLAANPGVEAVALAFGAADTRLAGLLFVSTTTGELLALDVESLDSVTLATGGARGAFLVASPDGRLYVATGEGVDVVFPARPPEVLASDPADRAGAPIGISQASVTFDSSMFRGGSSDARSVTRAENYQIIDMSTGAEIRIGAALYDPESRAVTLVFDALAPSTYELRVSNSIQDDLGNPLAAEYAAEFVVAEDRTAVLAPGIEYSTTRLDRLAGTVSFDIRLRNSTDASLSGPVRVILDGIHAQNLQVVGNNSGVLVDATGLAYVELVGDAGTLLPDALTGWVTVTVRDPDAIALDLASRIQVGTPRDSRPVFVSDPVTVATASTAYTYRASATDPVGGGLSYVLVTGPSGASLDPASGVLTWAIPAGGTNQVAFEIRAIDAQGAYARQSWRLDVSGLDLPPVLAPILDVQTTAGEAFTVTFAAVDPEGAPLVFWMDRLPAGATFDAASRTLRWTPGGQQAGVYPDLRLTVSDGVNETSRSFTAVVLPGNLPPVFQTAVERTVSEGTTLAFTLRASDPEGDPVRFGSPNLPAGAVLVPDSGQFLWTPSYAQHGQYDLVFEATDGTSTARQTVRVVVLNVNGPVRFVPLDALVIPEGQPLSVRVVALDPNVSGTGSGSALGGEVTDPETQATLTYTVSNLPAGAAYDPVTQLLTWRPTFSQAGTYSIQFSVANDGDGTAVPSRDQLTVRIDVADTNGTPELDPISNQFVDVGASLTIPIRAIDPDAGPLRLSVEGLPRNATFVDNNDGTGSIRVLPQPGDRGNYTVTILATDNGNGVPAGALTGTTSFILAVRAANEPPVIAPVGDKVALIDQPLVFNVRVEDPDQDPLTFAAENLPAGAAFVGTTVYGVARFTWTPTLADAGTHTVTLQVADSGNDGAAIPGTDRETVRIIVRASNEAPTLTAIGDRTANQTETIAFTLRATDPDGDTLTYFGDSLPAGASLDAVTGQFRWTPDFTQFGSFVVVLGATDGHRTVTESVTFRINRLNRAPFVATPAPTLGQEGLRLAFTIAGGDLDDDPLIYYAEALPAGATFDPETRLFSWTPGYDQAGVYQIVFTARDSSGALGSARSLVQVLNVNRPPEFQAPTANQILAGQPFSLPIAAADPDGDAITYSLGQRPAGMTFDAEFGVVTWTPVGAQAGRYDLPVTVSDGRESVTQLLTLVVNTLARPPSVRIDVTPGFPVVPGANVTLQVTASSIAPVSSVALSVNGAARTLDSFGRFVFLPPAPGIYSIVATTVDADGFTATLTSEILVRDPLDRTAPTTGITGIVPGTILTTPASVVGTVQDSNLDRWTLELAPLDGSTPVELASSRTSVDGALATLDPGRFENGAYQLRLTAVDIGGRTTRTEYLVEINTPTKPGAYVRIESDFTLSLGGVSIPIARRYSSLNASKDGDFGFGWQFVLADPALSTNLPPTGREADGFFAPLTRGTRVYVTLPDGVRAGFTFQPVAIESGDRSYFRPAWTPDPGVTFSLTSGTAVLRAVGDAFYQVGTGLPYNPDSGRFGGFDYAVTASDGTR
ncbi:MAG: putative Ig domain-containing protein, partial [Limisphaerales bacterium]